MPSAHTADDPSLPLSSSSTSKPISISLAAAKSDPQTKPASAIKFSATKPSISNPRKRPHSSLNNDSDSDPDPDAASSTHQLVSAFDHAAGGAISANGTDASKAKGPLVIQRIKNRDWREESRRKRGGRNLLPAEVQQAQGQKNKMVLPGQTTAEGADVERDEIGKVSGLQLVAAKGRDDGGDVVMDVEGKAVVAVEGKGDKAKTADEEALEALMGDGTRKSTLVVPAVAPAGGDEDWRNGRAGPENEDDQFRSDVASRPDPASLDDYARVPVEEFGLGMLRGMGWKEGEVVGKRKDQVSKPRVVERRPALLGIGAKEVPGGVGEELGAWGKAAGKGGKKKVDKTYNPVVLKNHKTGEMLTEEELAAKKEKQVADEREWKKRRDRNLALDQERKGERRREKERTYEELGSRSRRKERSRSRRRLTGAERSRSAERSRHGSSRRERSSSRERRHRSNKRSSHGDGDRREKDRKRREKHEGDDSISSRRGHRSREDHDDTRRSRHEVY
ncbi:MAG: hypothetical protein LQ344_007242 [Seirophora lacunosa]|nr:MAG: hypothetical protein LQ344_007242 [Seirophora lacunosa]